MEMRQDLIKKNLMKLKKIYRRRHLLNSEILKDTPTIRKQFEKITHDFVQKEWIRIRSAHNEKIVHLEKKLTKKKTVGDITNKGTTENAKLKKMVNDVKISDEDLKKWKESERYDDRVNYKTRDISNKGSRLADLPLLLILSLTGLRLQQNNLHLLLNHH